MSTYLYGKYLDLLTEANIPHVDYNAWDSQFNQFAEELAEFCTENDVLISYRFIRKVENDLKIRIKYAEQIEGNCICHACTEKLLNAIKIEKDIIEIRSQHPKFTENGSFRPIPKLLQWTESKIALVELIYAISSSINNGKATIKEIRDCFEFIFQIKIGTYCYDGLEDILLRKGKPARYLFTLIDNLEDHIRRISSK